MGKQKYTDFLINADNENILSFGHLNRKQFVQLFTHFIPTIPERNSLSLLTFLRLRF